MSIQDVLLSEAFRTRGEYTDAHASEDPHDIWDRSEDILAGMGLSIPPFMTFPEPPPLYVIKYDHLEELFYVEGDTFPSNTSLSALHDEIYKAGGDVLFDDASISKAKNVSTEGIRSEASSPHGRRVLIGWLDPRPYAANAYWDFLTNAREYLRDPKSFYAAYCFIDKHPMFWYQTEHGSWVDEYGFSTLSIDVFMTKKGLRVGLEGGAATRVRPDEHFHDYRLDATRKTFEKAVVAFAKNVFEHFDLDGTDYEKGL